MLHLPMLNKYDIKMDYANLFIHTHISIIHLYLGNTQTYIYNISVDSF
jgi:hypothetical protein